MDVSRWDVQPVAARMPTSANTVRKRRENEFMGGWLRLTWKRICFGASQPCVLVCSLLPFEGSSPLNSAGPNRSERGVSALIPGCLGRFLYHAIGAKPFEDLEDQFRLFGSPDLAGQCFDRRAFAWGCDQSSDDLAF